MFKKILICAVSIAGLAPVSAFADAYYAHYRHPGYAQTHWQPAGGYAWRGTRAYARPAVIRGYYGAGFATRYGTTYGAPDPYAPLNPQPGSYQTDAGAAYTQPFVAYSSATAYVPVTTYAAVPVRVYYIPQQPPYYNVPPYVVRPSCFCD
jgi:opacity protein-like surface antigen